MERGEMTNRVFVVRPNVSEYRNLEWDASWRLDLQFLYSAPFEQWSEPTLSYMSLEDDLEEEEELLEMEEGDPQRAYDRFAKGPADCALVRGFNAGLLLSEKAQLALDGVLKTTGELFQTTLDEEIFYYYHCTRLVNAAIHSRSEVRCVDGTDGPAPSEWLSVFWSEEIVKHETIFKTTWPIDNLSIEVPPPIQIFATNQVRDIVDENHLTGFEFMPIGQIEIQ